MRKFIVEEAKLLRRQFRRTRQAFRFHRLNLAGVPMIFGNSFPKSGTHLLTQILTAFSQVSPVVDSGLPPVLTFEGASGRQRDLREILHDLDRLKSGDIAYGHLHAYPEVVARLCRDGVIAYFIYRDPRDVVVSHVHYVTEMAPNHVHHDYYRNHLKTFNERLRVSILGRDDAQHPFPNIRERFEPYLPWLERQEVLGIKFESLVHEREKTLLEIIHHAQNRGLSFVCSTDDVIQKVLLNIDPRRSPTFRSGKVGRWREAFTPELKELFKRVSGDLLIKLGYEDSLDW